MAGYTRGQVCLYTTIVALVTLVSATSAFLQAPAVAVDGTDLIPRELLHVTTDRTASLPPCTHDVDTPPCDACTGSYLRTSSSRLDTHYHAVAVNMPYRQNVEIECGLGRRGWSTVYGRTDTARRACLRVSDWRTSARYATAGVAGTFVLCRRRCLRRPVTASTTGVCCVRRVPRRTGRQLRDRTTTCVECGRQQRIYHAYTTTSNSHCGLRYVQRGGTTSQCCTQHVVRRAEQQRCRSGNFENTGRFCVRCRQSPKLT
jgi:hypothetical protein